MSFYRAMNGKNPQSESVLSLIGLSPMDIERFRDCGINKREGFIWVLARTGGPNRVTGLNANLFNNEYFKKYHDEKFDPSYAIYYFHIPKEVNVNAYSDQDIPDLKKITDEAVANIEAGNISKETQTFMDMLSVPLQHILRK